MSRQDFQRIAKAIRYLEDRALDQPSLEEVAGQVNLGPHHFQRLFKRWAGVSPKRYLQFLTLEHAKTLLSDSNSVLDASFQTGLSGPGRLHDLFVSVDAVTPGEFRNAGENLDIVTGFYATPFGNCLLAETVRGICFLGFVPRGEETKALETLKASWPNARIRQDHRAGQTTIDTIFSWEASTTAPPVKLLLKGTNFQLKVWEALLRIPPGTVTSYGALAEKVGRPNASRAVGNAVGTNPVAYLIPCHRVLRANGALGGYRWGNSCKRALLALEASRMFGDENE